MPSPCAHHDRAWMARALALAARARGRTAPNPMVGAIVVSDGQLVGEGFHERAGTAHAEPIALAQAGRRARGATLYVTLEPCHHTGRTGPCTTAIVTSGIARVVVGASDNDQRVLGRGLAYLRAENIQVDCGVLQSACARLNTAYHFAKTTGRCFVSSLGGESDGANRRLQTYRRQVLQAVDALCIEAKQWSVPSVQRLIHQMRQRSAAVFVWDAAGQCSLQDASQAGVIVVRPSRRQAKSIAPRSSLWSLAGPQPVVEFFVRCAALGLHHVTLLDAPKLARQADDDGMLCRQLVVTRHRRLQGADWCRLLDEHAMAQARWRNDAQRLCGRAAGRR